MTNDPCTRLLQAAVKAGAARKPQRLQAYFQHIARGIEFANRTFLDIGGGSGVFALYAACQGVRSALCLEPEMEGSTARVTQLFEELKAAASPLGERASLAQVTLQDFCPGNQTFDIVVLNNAINHIDEAACINLLKDARSREVYLELFRKIASFSSPNADLIVTDCSRNNFFGSRGWHNPFAPTIEWHKHQAPETWSELLQEAGFTAPRIRWTPVRCFGRLGRTLLGNRAVAHLMMSHFCLHMKKPASIAPSRDVKNARAA